MMDSIVKEEAGFMSPYRLSRTDLFLNISISLTAGTTRTAAPAAPSCDDDAAAPYVGIDDTNNQLVLDGGSAES